MMVEGLEEMNLLVKEHLGREDEELILILKLTTGGYSTRGLCTLINGKLQSWNCVDRLDKDRLSEAMNLLTDSLPDQNIVKCSFRKNMAPQYVCLTKSEIIEEASWNEETTGGRGGTPS